MKRIKKNFLTGFISLLPAFATVYVIVFVYRIVSGVVRIIVPVERITAAYILVNRNMENLSLMIKLIVTIISIGVILFLIFLIGFSINTFISKSTLSFFEGIILKIPLANSIYTSIKQFVNLLFSKNNDAYKKTVLIEYPKNGIYSLALVTKEGNKNIEDILKQGEMINVFIPTAPNPTSGFYMILRKEDTKELNITVEETFKSVISGGTLSPKIKKGE